VRRLKRMKQDEKIMHRGVVGVSKTLSFVSIDVGFNSIQ